MKRLSVIGKAKKDAQIPRSRPNISDAPNPSPAERQSGYITELQLANNYFHPAVSGLSDIRGGGN
jgi:hypothetical protein